jgi:BlaI family transcriptional regulator, penicillinase repressor
LPRALDNNLLTTTADVFFRNNDIDVLTANALRSVTLRTLTHGTEIMNGTGRKPLGPLEHAVMQIIWDKGSATADDVRTALQSNDHKESTIRTILRRLEEKGYLAHEVEGRTFLYRAIVGPQSVASRQVRGILERFCRGSVENLLLGMVDDQLITPAKLKELADRISGRDKQSEKKDTKRRKPG